MGGEIARGLARFESILSSAQEQLAEARTDEEKRILSAKVETFQSAVDLARGQLLPDACRDALKLLVEHASDEWLARHPSSEDPEGRHEFVQQTIELQLLASLFRPNVDPDG